MSTPDTDTTPGARACGTCGAGLERSQDWCLECGTAVPGRLGGLRPGWRAVGTTLALTLALVGGAGAASYAALSSDASRQAIASAPGDATPVAQAPPGVPAPAAPTVPAIPVTPPVGPTVKTPSAKLPTAPKVAAVPVPKTTTTAQVTPPASTTSSSTPRSSTTSSSTAAGSRGEGTSADGTKSTPVALTPITLGADAVSVYDPYRRAVSPGDPAEAYDGDAQTTFEVGAPDDGRELQVGVVVDLEARKQVRGLEFTTPTPGGRVEVYATDSSTLPPDVLDTRWDHPASRSDVDGKTRGGDKAGDGKERIVFPKGGATYRYVVLWFTTPPEGTTRVGVTELKLLA